MRKLAQFKLIGQLAALLALAAMWPEAETAVLSVFPVNSAAVALIFFVTGVSTETRRLFDAVRNIRLHAFIQGVSFVFFPLLIGATRFPFDDMLNGQIVIGLYALACVPTTMSSCVVFTMLAGGNRAVALLNAVLGNLMALVLSPLIFVLLARTGRAEVEIDKLLILANIGTLVAVPFLIGQLCPARLRAFFLQRPRLCARVNESAILAIVFFSFCSLFRRQDGSLGVADLSWLTVYLAAAHTITLGFVCVGVRLLRVTREDRIAACFTAPQKTLAFGLPLIMVLCARTPEIDSGAVSLPLVIYHSMQLVTAAILKDRFLVRATPRETMAG